MVFIENHTDKEHDMTLSQEQNAVYASLQHQPVSFTVGFIGAGKVGFSMGKYLRDRGIPVSGYYSRSAASSREAADFTGTRQYVSLPHLVRDSSVLFFTVPDGAIRQTYQEISSLPLQGKHLVHCSGSLSSLTFAGAGELGAKACSLHPICAVSSKHTGHQALEDAFFTIEGDDTKEIMRMIRQCGNRIESIPAEKKVLYHGAAVFASNLVVGLYHAAATILEGCGLSTEFASQALLPLFLGNARTIARQGTEAALTGPVERGDSATVANHLQELSGQQREIYRLLSLQILDVARRKNPSRDYSPTEEIIRQATSGQPSEAATPHNSKENST